MTALALQQSVVFEPKYHAFVLQCKRDDHAKYMREWRLKHPEYRKRQKEAFARFLELHPDYQYEYNQKWKKAHPFNVLQTTRRYCQRHPEYRREHRKRYAKRHPDRKSARKKALRLTVEGCIHCGSNEKIERHHPDYAQPLQIIPLCHNCHVKEHREA